MSQQKTVEEVLVTAKKIIGSPNYWTRGVFAETLFPCAPCSPGHPLAYRFCGIGAVRRAVFGQGPMTKSADSEALHHSACMALRKITFERYGLDYPDWQDQGEVLHADVMAVFEEAILTERESKMDHTLDSLMDLFHVDKSVKDHVKAHYVAVSRLDEAVVKAKASPGDLCLRFDREKYQDIRSSLPPHKSIEYGFRLQYISVFIPPKSRDDVKEWASEGG